MRINLLRIAVISDIHGNLPVLQVVLADIAAEGSIFNCGDSLGGLLELARWVELLIQRGTPRISSNHEH